MSASLNIILFGETGVGKSSVINLIAERQIAETSRDVQGCTLSSQQHTFFVNGRNYCIWDTVGLDEPNVGVDGYLPAIEQAWGLIQKLTSRGGVDLLLFCVRGRITATAQSNYRLFDEVLCKSKVPIALVITHLERESDMEEYWKRHGDELKRFNMKFAGHACVTGLPTDSKYAESRQNIIKLLETPITYERFSMPSDGWLIEFLRLFGLFAPLKKIPKKKDILKVLTKRCKLNPKVAEDLAAKLESGITA